MEVVAVQLTLRDTSLTAYCLYVPRNSRTLQITELFAAEGGESMTIGETSILITGHWGALPGTSQAFTWQRHWTRTLASPCLSPTSLLTSKADDWI